MSQPVHLGKRDLALLGFLERTPATAVHIRTVSVTFPGEPFRDDRRVRERLQALAQAGYVNIFPAAIGSGGLMHYYRLTLAGYRALHPDRLEPPARSLLAEISPSFFRHALTTAEVLVHTLVATRDAHLRVAQCHGDGALTLVVGQFRQQPDCHVQLECAGQFFNVLFEIDNATEPLDSPRDQSIKTKLLGYEAYQDWVLRIWHDGGRVGPRPGFRVVFLVPGAERGHHILWLARACARNPDRRLCYATTQDTYFGEPRALTAPIFNDHHGHWQALVDLYPSSAVLRAPVRLTPPLAPPRGL